MADYKTLVRIFQYLIIYTILKFALFIITLLYFHVKNISIFGHVSQFFCILEVRTDRKL